MKFLVPVRQMVWAPSTTAFSELYKLCKDDATSTELVPITSSNQLLLHPAAGRTPEGLRFNSRSFRDVCGLLSGGLATLLREIAQAGPVESPPYQAKLLQVYNAAVKLLGGKVQGYRLVVDRRHGVIVGAVGRSYRYVPNADLLQAAASYFASSKYKLTHAAMWNRDLTLLCTNRDLVANSGVIKFQQGLALYNSETTRRAIFTPRIIYDSGSGAFAMETESEDNRMIHRRTKQFAQKMDELLTTAFRSESLLTDVCRRHAELSQETLGTSQSRQVVLASISSRLTRRQINTLPATRVASVLERVKALTGWALYTSLVTVAGDFKSSERRLRMAAFEYLMKGKL